VKGGGRGRKKVKRNMMGQEREEQVQEGDIKGKRLGMGRGGREKE
jgi:hypothetical protein